MPRYRLGMAGIVGHSDEIFEGIRRLPHVTLAAVAVEPEAAEQASGLKDKAAVTTETRFYHDYREMLAKEELDIVGVFGIDGRRAAMLRECAAAGCHIIAEKPLAMNLDELASVREAIASAGVQMTMLLTMRSDGLYQAARSLAAKGAIGEAAQISAQKSYKLGRRPEWMQSRATFSGVIPYVGIHMIDLMRWISGREFTKVAAFQSNVTRGVEIRAMEDNASVLLEMDNGGTATLRIDYLRPATAPTHGDDRIRLVGGKGVLEVRGAERFLGITTEAEGERRPDVPQTEPFFVQFVRSLDGRGASPAPADDCYRATENCLRARDAAARGEVASLTP